MKKILKTLHKVGQPFVAGDVVTGSVLVSGGRILVFII